MSEADTRPGDIPIPPPPRVPAAVPEPTPLAPATLLTLDEVTAGYIAEAAAYLEQPGFLVRLTNKLGRPAELLMNRLPGPAGRIVTSSTDKALKAALRAALFSLPREVRDVRDLPVRTLHATTFQSGSLHSGAAYVTGFTGGMLGAAALPVELPATTAIMLRSIGDIAQRMGADLSDKQTRLECLAVFGLGSGAPAGEELRGALEGRGSSVDTGYYAVRSSLTSATRAAASWAATATPQQVGEALVRGKSTALAKLIAAVAARFSVVVSQKTVLQLLPVLGAATATASNLAFVDHFNHVARYHFGLRLLEQRYGEDAVRTAYEGARLALPAPK